MAYIPGEPETARGGMNNRDNAKLLEPHVANLLVNALPTAKKGIIPRNGCLELIYSNERIGYGTYDTLICPTAVWYAYDDNEFLIGIERNRGVTKDEYAIVVWNLTDGTRTKIEGFRMSVDDVYFGMKRIFNTIYMVSDHVITTNRTHGGITGNQIIQWNKQTSSWHIRDMMLNLAGGVTAIPAENRTQIFNGIFPPKRSEPTLAVSYNGYIWAIHRPDNYSRTMYVVRSKDGRNWETITKNAPCSGFPGALVVYKNAMWFFTKESGYYTAESRTYRSTDGINWTLMPSVTTAVTQPSPSGMSVAVNGDTLLVCGSRYAFKTTDGVNYTLVQTNPPWKYTYAFGLSAIAGQFVLFGGHYCANQVGPYNSSVKTWLSTDAITWTPGPDLPNARGHFGWATDGDKIVIVEGINRIGSGEFPYQYTDTYLGTVIRGYLNNNGNFVWELIDYATGYPSANSACVSHNGKWYVIAGHGPSPHAEYQRVSIGEFNSYTSKMYWSSVGIGWLRHDEQPATKMYAQYAATFIRRTDDNSTLKTIDDYRYDDNQWYYPLIDLPGWISMDVTNKRLWGVVDTTSFTTALSAGDIVTPDAGKTIYRVVSVVSDTEAIIVNNPAGAGCNTGWKVGKAENVVVGIDEVKLSGLLALSGTNLTADGGQFITELIPNSYVRLNGDNCSFKVVSIENDNLATVDNPQSMSYQAAIGARLPAINSIISTSVYHTGDAEAIYDTSLNVDVTVDGIDNYYGACVKAVSTADCNAAITAGMTHLRVYRSSLSSVSLDVARGTSKLFLVDIELSAAAALKTFFDQKSLVGETNAIEITGYEPPPPGAFIDYDDRTGLLWVGGNPDYPGYWWHSATPRDTANPQKYLSWFDTDANYITCAPQDGAKDSGTVSLAGDRYFFKESGVWMLNRGDPDNAPRKISSIGCCFPNTIQVVDIPKLGGFCVIYLSGHGPAVLMPGGRIQMLNAFAISEIWPGGEVHENRGTRTNWHTRNKVISAWFKGIYWIMWGDSMDTDMDMNGRCWYGYQCNSPDETVGALEVRIAEQTGASGEKYPMAEPQAIVVADLERAYFLSHMIDNQYQVRWRLFRFMEPTIWVDRMTM